MPKWLKLTKDWKAEKAGKILQIENDVQADTLVEAGIAEATEDPTKDIIAEVATKAAEQRQQELKDFGTKVAEEAVQKYLSAATKIRSSAGGESSGRPHIVVSDPNEFSDPKFGFKTFGEQLRAVRDHCIGRGTDEKLATGEKAVAAAIKAKALSNYSGEGVGADGGFTIAPDFNTEILSHVYSDEAILPRCRQVSVAGNTATFIKDETVAWGTDGVQAYWAGEATVLNDSKIKLGEINITLHKLTILVPVTNELLEDSAIAIGQYVMQAAQPKLADKINGAIIGNASSATGSQGQGAGQPLGILNSPAAIQQNKDSGQAANTITFSNAVNMLSRMPAYSQRNAVWLHHSTAFPQIAQMTVGNFPVFTPPGGANAAPFGSLLGKPLIPSEQCQSLTNKGDINLVDFKQYLAVTKGSGLRSDMSVHLYFDRDISAFRFVFRIGGQPWLQAPITQKNGSGTLSPFVYLQNR